MSRPKVHHYAPQFLLRGFVSGKKDQLHAFDKQTGRTYLTPVSRAAAETGFNDVHLASSVWAEDAFGVLERDAAPVFKRIVQEQSLGSLTQWEREVVAIFVAAQHLRTRNFREMLQDMNARMADLFRSLDLDPSKDVKGFTLLPPDEVSLTSLRLLGMIRELAPQLLAKTWVLFKNETKQPFYISDNPVAIENPAGGGVGFGVPGVEISMPLSGSLMLSMLCPSYEQRARRTVRQARWLGPLRPLLAARLWPELATARVLVQAVDAGRPLSATANEVRHYNSLRIFYANRHVYSGTDDFGLVRDLLRDHPELRTGPRVEIG